MRKKLFVGVLAVGVALMLVALPYESNAQFGEVAIAVAIGGALLGGVGIGYLLFHKHSNANQHPAWTTDYQAYQSAWNNEFDYITNMLTKDDTTAINMINTINASKLYWERQGEYTTMYYLNKTTWDNEIENAVVEPFNIYMENLTAILLEAYLQDYKELLLEYAKIGSISDSTTNGKLHVNTNDYTIASGIYNNYVNSIRIIFGDVPTFSSTADAKDFMVNVNDNLNTTQWKIKYSDNDGDYKVIFENTTDYNDMFNSQIWITYHIVAKNETNATKINFYALHKLNTNTGSKNAWICNNGNVGYLNTGSLYYWIYINGGNYNSNHWFKSSCNWQTKLYNTYTTIKNNIVDLAQTQWQTYKDMGYNNISDIPNDEKVIFPDLALENPLELGNLSFNDSYLLWRIILNSLANSTFLNKSKINWNDFVTPDYSGKVLTITLTKYADKTNISNNTILIDNHKCYVLPYQEITIMKGKTYLISNTSTFSNDYANIQYDYIINKHIEIFDLENYNFYEIYPNSDVVYTMHVGNITINGTSVNSTTFKTIPVGKWLYPYIYTSNDSKIPLIHIPNGGNGDWLNWITQHKGILTIGLIVLGILFTASTRKSDGLHSLGIIMLLLGIGMAFYFYLLPAWHNFTNFIHNLNPLNWFKR